jgi:ribosomal protein S19
MLAPHPSQHSLTHGSLALQIKPRAHKITIEDVGILGLVHNGRTHVRVKPTTLHVGHRWGEFAITRKICWPVKKVERNKKKRR